MFKSTDGGASWIAINTGLPYTRIYALMISDQAPGILYAGTGGGGVWKYPTAPLTSTDLNLEAGGAAQARTVNSKEPTQAGYARVSVNSGAVPYGTAVFSFKQNGVIASEAGVPVSPPTTGARLFVDYRSGVPGAIGRSDAGTIDIDTGIAIVNTGSATANITYTLRNMMGTTISTGHGVLASGGHFAKFIDQLKEVAPDFNLPPDFQTGTGFGSLEIVSDQPLSVVALRETINQRHESLFTTTPIADLTQPLTSDPIYFPQFVDGGGYTTALILLNTSNALQTGTFQIFDDNGAPLGVNQVGGTTDSSFKYSIPAAGTIRFQTDGFPASVKAGWVLLTPDAGTSTPIGAGVFSYSNGAILVSESGIPAAASTTHARVYVDLSPGHDTGLAIANPASTNANITISAYQTDGVTPIGTSQGPLQLPGNGHSAKFANQFIAGLPTGFTGVLDITSATPFAALTLRSLNNERNDFLITTFPVADANQIAPSPVVFPQIADGGGFVTEFILLSAGGASGTTLSYFGEDGRPLAVGRGGVSPRPTVDAPVFSPAPGTYTTTQRVTLSTTTPGATIRYTTDGSTPTETVGTEYTGPIPVASSVTIQAVAYLAGWTTSSVSKGAYAISMAGIGAWTRKGPEGGHIRCIVVGPQNPTTIYAATEGGLFKSTDEGHSWSELTNKSSIFARALAIDPGDSNIVYAALDNSYPIGVLKSTDGGKSWASTTDPWSAWALAIDSRNPSTVYAAGWSGITSGVFKTVDAGLTWTQVLSSFHAGNGPARALAVNPMDSTTVYAAVSGTGIYKSTDAGEHWELLFSTPAALETAVLAIDSSTPTTVYAGTWSGGVLKSIDAGAHWEAVNDGLTNLAVPALAVDPRTTSTLYAGTGDGLFKSVDGGQTWSQIYDGRDAVNAVVLDPRNPATLYAGTSVGIIKTADSGTSWAAQNRGLIATSINAVSLDPETPATVYIATEGMGLFKSTDRGTVWSSINSRIPTLYIEALAIDPRNPATLYAGTKGAGIYKSVNQGVDWVPINDGLAVNASVYSVTIDADNPSTIYAGTTASVTQVLKSMDGGITWRDLGLPFRLAGVVNTIAIDPQNPQTLYVAGEGIYKSTDGGATWVAHNNGLTPLTSVYTLAIDHASPSTLYLGAWNGAYKSVDGGELWNPIPLNTPPDSVNAIVVDPDNSLTIYVGTSENGVFKSIDGGAHWSPVGTGLPARVNALAIDPGSPENIYAGTGGAGLFRLDLTPLHASWTHFRPAGPP